MCVQELLGKAQHLLLEQHPDVRFRHGREHGVDLGHRGVRVGRGHVVREGGLLLQRATPEAHPGCVRTRAHHGGQLLREKFSG